MKKRLGIVGVGSAGILALCHFLPHLDKDWEIVSIYDPTKPILGIGESSNPSFITALEKAAEFNMLEHSHELDGTYKFGTMWKNWRDHQFLGPLLGGSAAIHFNNFKLREFIIPRLKRIWGDKFSTITGNVDELTNVGTHVKLVVDGVEHALDYAMDCRGFPTNWNNYHVCPTMQVNHALVHNIEKPGDWEYTGHRATRNGWMFEIPLTTRQSYGYLFNDKITNIEDAKQDFSNEINVPVEELQDIEYKFQSYYSTAVCDGRIMKNGNRAIFFEPISATSIFVYDQANKLFFNYLIGHFKTKEEVNNNFVDVAKAIEELIYWFYHGGSIYDTPFWQNAKSTLAPIVQSSSLLRTLIPSFRKWNSNSTPVYAETWFYAPHLMKKLDRDFGFNYFQNPNAV